IPINVTHLLLDTNQISSVPANSFSECLQLISLILNSNRISYVDGNAFTGTVIVALNLNYNELTAVPDLSSIEQTLKTLYIQRNRISNINNATFPGNLRFLYLGRNYISSFNSNL
ncbi:hypothetical protein CAPTEDRAFT_48417, partial [Capitella teleta]